MRSKSPLPLYYRIYLDLREKITNGTWKSGDELPSETELRDTYACARQTVRQGLSRLAQDGLIVRRHGVGTFVAEDQIVQPVGRIYSTSETIRARGEQPDTVVLAVDEVPADDFRTRLGLPDDVDVVYKLRRLRLANNHPLALMTTYIPSDLVPDFRTIIRKTGSLYEVFEAHYGFHLTEATEVVGATKLNAADAELLACESGDPALLVERTTHIDSGRIIESLTELFRYDRFKMSIKLEGRDARLAAETTNG